MAVLLAAVAVYFLCAVPFRANLVLPTITQRTMNAQDVDSLTAAPIARGNLQDLDRIGAAERLNPNWYLLYGTNCEILGRKAEAVEIYSRALRIDQRPEIYVHRGMVMLQLGQMDAAVNDLATAARFNPFVLYDLSGDLALRVDAASKIH